MDSALRGPQWPSCLIPPRPGTRLGGATARSRTGSARGPGSWCCSWVTQPSWGSELISPGKVHRLPPGPHRVGLTRLGSCVPAQPCGHHTRGRACRGNLVASRLLAVSAGRTLKLFLSFGSLVLLRIKNHLLLCVKWTEGGSVQLCLPVGPRTERQQAPCCDLWAPPSARWGAAHTSCLSGCLASAVCFHVDAGKGVLGGEAQVSCCPWGWAEAGPSSTGCCWDFLGGDTPPQRSKQCGACLCCAFRLPLRSAAPFLASALPPGAQCFLWP